MAWNDLIVKVGMDSSGFAKGTMAVKRDVKGLQDGTLALSRTITDQKAKLRELWQTQGGNSKAYKALKQDIRESETALRSMNRELMNTVRTQKTAGGGFADMLKGGNIGQAVMGGIIGGGVAGLAMGAASGAMRAMKEGVTVAINFDDSMRKVAATTGATAGQFEQLKAAAIDMGSQTKFTASQAAEALNFMALAGWKTEQSIAALPGVLNLAAAAGMDLGKASDIVTDQMTVFNMAASRAGEVADMMAKAQSTANTNVDQLGEALKYSGAAAAASNQPMNETVSVLMMLADSSIKGSMAGTGLVAFMQGLKKNAVDGKMALGQFNVEIYNADGSMRKLTDIIKDMRSAMAGLTNEERDAILQGKFREQGLRTLNSLLNLNEDAINKNISAMGDFRGTAAKMAETMEGGAGGAIRRMKSEWEALTLAVTNTDAWVGAINLISGQLGLARRTAVELGEAWDRMLGRVKQRTAEEMAEIRAQISSIRVDDMDMKFAYQGLLQFKKSDPVKVPASLEFDEGESFAVTQKLITDLKKRLRNMEVGSQEWLTLSGQIREYEAQLKSANGTLKTAATEYAAFQQELKRTGEFMRFVGNENEYIATAAQMTATKMEQVYMMGGKQAEQYATKLRSELAALLSESRATTLQPVAAIGMVTPTFTPTLPSGFAEQFKAVTLIQQDLRNELVLIGKEAQVFGNTYDKVGHQVTATARAIQDALALPGMTADNPAITALTEQLRTLREQQRLQTEEATMQANQQAANMQFMGAMIQNAGSTFEAMAAGSATAGDALRSFASTALATAADIVKSNMLAAASGQIKWAASLGPIGIGIAAAGIAGLFGLLQGAMTKSKSVRLAKGGLAYGETLATVGDNPGARFDPEVVAPLSKLEAMINTGGSDVSGTFRIEGEDLVLVLDQAQRKMKRFRV